MLSFIEQFRLIVDCGCRPRAAEPVDDGVEGICLLRAIALESATRTSGTLRNIPRAREDGNSAGQGGSSSETCAMDGASSPCASHRKHLLQKTFVGNAAPAPGWNHSFARRAARSMLRSSDPSSLPLRSRRYRHNLTTGNDP